MIWILICWLIGDMIWKWRFWLDLPGTFIIGSIPPFRSGPCDVIVAFSFGARNSKDEDVVNKALADIVRAEQAVTGAKIIAQREIAVHLEDLKPILVIDKSRKIEETHVDTREVAMQAYWKAEKDFKPPRASIVAHPDHMLRCIWSARKAGFQVTAATDTSAVPYDKASLQKWTRSQSKFRRHEIGAKLSYLRKGWI